MTDLTILDDLDDEQRSSLQQLALAYGGGAITRDEFFEFGQALGLLRNPEVDARPKRGHVKGDRLRAVPADWNRRGAVGA